MARYRNEDNVLMMFNRFYHMCKTKGQKTLVLDMKQAFLEIKPADVVPRSEVEKLQGENERLMREKTALECVVSTARNQAKQEVVRAILEEFEGSLEFMHESANMTGDIMFYWKTLKAEMEKKYIGETK